MIAAEIIGFVLFLVGLRLFSTWRVARDGHNLWLKEYKRNLKRNAPAYFAARCADEVLAELEKRKAI